ncbi:DNA-processing protein DprA [Phyllobacterium sp. 0TCS1.6C]|uniref:DNA-processing protein DprA n=1 Tax=unclassified Phyllobacterium TaxID=2638441 RepID=UPI0022643F4B|nr:MULTISPECIES: DNA-processing protein DprA [unclassified Phyllobacterium]MCX8281728.1 DNA-processing protein DprA [Phyllobacterium sp. 0TCS1.6C]MCX8294838.1 DNA-processing protein DprA [Phyllobacterium sp. 0TCS1.6A]
MNEARKGIRLSDMQRLNWLRLIRSENVGPATFRDLIAHCGTAADAIAMLPELVRRGGGKRQIRVASVEQVERELALAARMGACFTCIGEPDYPLYLRQADNPPPVVAIKGDPAVFRAPAVAIVGARNASMVGIKIARTFARELGEAGFAVISGLARGIDTAAHHASIEHGTVAVMAGGLDHPYPPENIELFNAIPARNGAVISEMPFGWEPRARDFPRRNRIIAALALGLVVVEAAERSGSLISARLASEMGRLVFAVPGSPLDPRAKGANQLLKNGAIVATETADIIEAVTPLSERPLVDQAELLAPAADFAVVPPPDETDRDRLITLLGPVAVDLDDLVRTSGLHPSAVMLILLELDLAGRLVRHSGGLVSLSYG